MEPIAAALKELTSILTNLAIPFFVCGSLASAARGVARATVDVDLVVRLSVAGADELARQFGSGWYADAEMIRDAIGRHRAFNVIHLASGLKFDIFPAVGDFHEAQLTRATQVPFFGGLVVCPVATLEDTILSKLQGYRLGGEVSERQWTDILGLLRATPPADLAYLESWGQRLGVAAHLHKALGEKA
jgi:hypothetical protein